MGSRSRRGRSRTTARNRRGSAFIDGQVDKITSKGNDLSAYELEPQLVTALFDAEQRSKRQIVKYNEIPPMMVQAVLAIEDRRFFEHSGVNFVRTGGSGLEST